MAILTNSLLWLLIFHSYCKSSTFGRPGLGRSPPLSNGNFTDSCSDCSYFFPTVRAQHLAGQGLAHLPLFQMSNFTDSWATLGAHIWQTKCWEIYPTSNGNFTDSCSDCSYFFPTLRAQHLADQVMAHLPLFQMAISQIPALTAHISFLLWELNIWQTRSWQISPPSNGIFTHSCSTLRVQHLADQVLGNLPLYKMAISQIPALTAHISFLL